MGGGEWRLYERQELTTLSAVDCFLEQPQKGRKEADQRLYFYSICGIMIIERTRKRGSRQRLGNVSDSLPDPPERPDEPIHFIGQRVLWQQERPMHRTIATQQADLPSGEPAELDRLSTPLACEATRAVRPRFWVSHPQPMINHLAPGYGSRNALEELRARRARKAKLARGMMLTLRG
jgi:hypothetical protein